VSTIVGGEAAVEVVDEDDQRVEVVAEIVHQRRELVAELADRVQAIGLLSRRLLLKVGLGLQQLRVRERHHLGRHVAAMREQRRARGGRRGAEEVDAADEAAEAPLRLIGEGGVRPRALLERPDYRGHQCRLHILVVLEAPRAEGNGEELGVLRDGVLSHTNQARLSGAPVSGDADRHWQQPRVAQDDQ
jgi:hypothetical protein